MKKRRGREHISSVRKNIVALKEAREHIIKGVGVDWMVKELDCGHTSMLRFIQRVGLGAGWAGGRV